jgi:hypothetical protein
MLDHAGQFAFTGNGMVSGCVAQLCGHIQKTFIFFLPAFLEKNMLLSTFDYLTVYTSSVVDWMCEHQWQIF